MSRTYPAKHLLFGEYTVLQGSQALAVPLSIWHGHWVKKEADQGASSAYFQWLYEQALIDEVTRQHMNAERKDGWLFSSDIPIGHGVGSSGAYVAATYDRYFGNQRSEINESPAQVMAKMESYFHGSSSGMDPLVSYKNQAVLKDEQGLFHIIPDPGWPEGYRIYLWDSRIDRVTSTLVHVFSEKLSRPNFKTDVERMLIPMVDHAIHFYLSGTKDMLDQCLSTISLFQRQYFTEMIPDVVKKRWDECLEQQGVYMKLCGAGGGGFFMIVSTRGEEVNWPDSCEITRP